MPSAWPRRARRRASPPIAARTRLSVSSCRTDLPARRAERRADGEFLAAAPRPRASIRFATLAHAMSSTNPTAPSSSHSAGLRRVAEEVVLERLDAGAPARVGFRKRLRQVGRDGHHVRVGLLKSDAGLQPAHDEQPVKVVVHLLRLECQRQIQPPGSVGRPGREDADDGVGLAVDANLAPDDVADRRRSARARSCWSAPSRDRDR